MRDYPSFRRWLAQQYYSQNYIGSLARWAFHAGWSGKTEDSLREFMHLHLDDEHDFWDDIDPVGSCYYGLCIDAYRESLEILYLGPGSKIPFEWLVWRAEHNPPDT